jgi:ribonuclease BN (tRNA processing enzyme)
VYGPVGLYNFIAASLSLSCAELNSLNVEVYELRGGSRRKWVHPGTIQNYPEFKNRGLFRKSIPQNKDGTWTLQRAEEITSPEEAEQSSSNSPTDDRGLYVHAAQVSHVPALQCFGYVVQEPLSMPQRVDVERAMAAGVKPGRKYRLLKAGFAVPSDDGSRRVHPKDVIVDGQPTISRKFALLGDCCGVPAPMAELCRDADVLVHEATLLQTGKFFVCRLLNTLYTFSDVPLTYLVYILYFFPDEGRKVERGGHSSASMAGVYADYVNAKVVALNHISPKNRENASIVIEEATTAIKGGTTRVQLSYDFLELFVPRTGFPFVDRTRK